MASRWRQDDAKMVPRWAKLAPRWAKMAPRSAKMAFPELPKAFPEPRRKVITTYFSIFKKFKIFFDFSKKL